MAESLRGAGKAYQATERGRARHRARSLAYYHRRGRQQRRQRRAAETAVLNAPPADTAGQVDESLGDPGGDAERTCLTHSRDCESGPAWGTFEATRAVLVVEVGADRCVAENDGAQRPSGSGPLAPSDEEPEVSAASGVAGPPAGASPRPGPVLTTVAQVRAALAHAGKVGAVGVDVWGRCARCGRVGRVVHFDGVLRARAQASW